MCWNNVFLDTFWYCLLHILFINLNCCVKRRVGLLVRVKPQPGMTDFKSVKTRLMKFLPKVIVIGFALLKCEMCLGKGTRWKQHIGGLMRPVNGNQDSWKFCFFCRVHPDLVYYMGWAGGAWRSWVLSCLLFAQCLHLRSSRVRAWPQETQDFLKTPPWVCWAQKGNLPLLSQALWRLPWLSLAMTMLQWRWTALFPSCEHLNNTFLINHIKLCHQEPCHEMITPREKCERLETLSPLDLRCGWRRLRSFFFFFFFKWKDPGSRGKKCTSE